MTRPAIRRALHGLAGLFLASGLAVGCDDDSGPEPFEADNEVDGSPSEGGPAGTVDSRDQVEGPTGDDGQPGEATTSTTA